MPEIQHVALCRDLVLSAGEDAPSLGAWWEPECPGWWPPGSGPLSGLTESPPQASNVS